MSRYPQNTYVGMRYVPLFDGEWNNAKDYEPLTVVSIEGNSYTSKTFVPAGVSPVGNPDYWAETGNYNAQIEAYRQEVLKYNDRIQANADAIAALDAKEEADITLLKKEKENNIFAGDVLIIGDSYAEGYTPDGNVESWAVKLKKKLGNGDNIHIAFSGGCGFYTKNSQQLNFKEIIANIIVSEKINTDNITCIICGGGYNDVSGTTVEQYDELAEYLTTFANSKNYCVYIGYGKTQSAYARINVPNTLSKSCEKNNVVFGDCSQILKGDFTNNYSSDNLHPSEKGQKLLAGSIFAFLNGSELYYGSKQHTFNLQIGEKSQICAFFMSKGIASFWTFEDFFANIDFTGILHNAKVATMKLDDNYGCINESLISFAVPINVKTSENKYLAGFALIKSTAEWNSYDVRVTVINEAKNNYFNGTISSIQFAPFMYTTIYNAF